MPGVVGYEFGMPQCYCGPSWKDIPEFDLVLVEVGESHGGQGAPVLGGGH